MRIIPKKKNSEKSYLDLKINPSSKNQHFGFNEFRKDGFFKEGFFLYIFLGWIFLIVVQAALIILYWSKFPAEIPLFYSLPWGQSILVKPLFIWVFPLITTIWGIIDFFLINASGDKFINRILVASIVIVTLLNIYGLAKIISLLI